jgi:hypothetical protein
MSDKALTDDQARLTENRRAQGQQVAGWREVLNPAPPASKAPGELSSPGGGAKQSIAPPKKR